MTNKFLTALTNTLDNNPDTTTENGAPSFSTTKDPRVDFFSKVCRGTSKKEVQKMMEKSLRANPQDALRLMYQLRDCRGGKGEREVFYHAFQWLANTNPNTAIKMIEFGHTQYYGYWKDLLSLYPLVPGNIRTVIVNTFCTQLQQDSRTLDRLSYEDVNGSVSLAAKWAPSESSTYQRKHKLARRFAEKLFPDARKIQHALQNYRKMITKLRAFTGVVEVVMCQKMWDTIDYSKVPSVAMKNYRKAFRKHDETRLEEFLTKVAKGEAKINAKQLFYHDLVREYLTRHLPLDKVIELQRDELLKPYLNGENSSLDGALAICDVSGSMEGTPMEVSIALGDLISQCSKGPFKNTVITFSGNPRLHRLPEGSLHDRVASLSRADWGNNTDLEKTMLLILQTAVDNKMSQADFPKRLYIISDMQFDQATESRWGSQVPRYETVFQSLKRQFQKHGYRLPEIVFWNVRGDTSDFPVINSETNVAMISGFSPSLLTTVLNGDLPNPYEIMRRAIDSDRYARVVV